MVYNNESGGIPSANALKRESIPSESADKRENTQETHPRTTIYDKISISPLARDLTVAALCVLFLALIFFAALR